MATQLQKSTSILIALLLVLTPLAASAPTASSRAQAAQEAMPDGLMSAFLAASSQPSEAAIDPPIYREQKVIASGAAGDGFGFSVALSGDTALVGVPGDDVGTNNDQGAAYVFTRSGTTWSLQQKLTASDGAANDFFGWSVALSGDTALVGAAMDDVGTNMDQGSAYVFVRSGTTWTQQAQLTASDGAASDFFGSSVALSGDTALIGAESDDVGANVNQGSAYVFTRSGTTWTQQTQLIASDGAKDDFFGGSVALLGTTALVGAIGYDVGGNADQGLVYVFVRSGTTWSLQQKLTASDGAAVDGFGSSVALSSNTALVGADNDDVSTNANQGSAYVFVRSGTTWTQQAHLTASDGAKDDYFGSSVALSGDTALVGVHFDDVGANGNQGSAYVFTRSGTTWNLQQKLTASDGAAGDGLGSSVALSGDTALVGAYNDDASAGAAYVFTRPNGGATWTQQVKLTALNGETWDNFGVSVALSGNTALAGAWLDNVGQGAAYVFVRNGTTWTRQTQLIASDGAAGDIFGWSVALSGDTALVGANGNDVGTNADQGSVYVFTRSGTTWTPQAKLTASDGAAGDGFGYSVALSGDTALVGALWGDVGTNADQGAAYVFTRSGTTWSEQAKLTASDGAAWDGFGYSVALSGNTALVGAYNDDVGGNTDQGSAYVFTCSETAWTQQAQLTTLDGAANDLFGSSVALSGDTALVGANGNDVGTNTDQGAAYVFTRSGTAWLPQVKLAASDGAAWDGFGKSAALSGDTALVGAPNGAVGTNTAQGATYVFTRSGPTWRPKAKLTASDGAAWDRFGNSVALSGDTVLVGASGNDVGTNADQGAAYFYQPDFPFKIFLPSVLK